MKKNVFLKVWKQKIESFIEIQQSVFDYEQQTTNDNFISIFPEEVFYCRISLLNILQIIIANASISNSSLIYSFFTQASAQIKSFFSSEDIFTLSEHNFIRLWLYENGFIQFETILAAAEYMPIIFKYFSIEIKEKVPSEFQRIQKNSPNFEYRTITKNLNFTTFREQRSKLMNDSLIAKVIREDDIDQFQEILSKTNISINSTIPYSIFEACQYVNRSESNMPTLIEFASFFGSLKIFKFLMMNDAELSPSVMDYAINGGNIEIIHILEDSNCSFETALDAAIHDQKDEIVDYILDNKLKEFDIDSICTAIANLNYKVLVRVLDMLYENANEYDSDGVTPLIYASENNNVEIVNLILSIDGIDVNKSDANNVKFPLLAAAKNNSVDVLNILLKKLGSIDINKKNMIGFDSLMAAIVCGNLEIVEILCNQKNISFKTNFDCSTNEYIKLAIMYGRLKIIKYLMTIYIFKKNCEENIDYLIVEAFLRQNWDIIKYFLSIHHDLWKINVFDKINEININYSHFSLKDIQKLQLLIDRFRKEK